MRLFLWSHLVFVRALLELFFALRSVENDVLTLVRGAVDKSSGFAADGAIVIDRRTAGVGGTDERESDGEGGE